MCAAETMGLCVTQRVLTHARTKGKNGGSIAAFKGRPMTTPPHCGLAGWGGGGGAVIGENWGKRMTQGGRLTKGLTLATAPNGCLADLTGVDTHATLMPEPLPVLRPS